MIRIRQIIIDIENYNKEEIKNKIASRLKIKNSDIIDFSINKESIDARKKDKINYVLEIDVKVKNENNILKKTKNKDIFKTPNEEYSFKITGNKKLKHRPVIVGSGPAGLFCAYMLLEAGFKPIIIERGKCIEERVEVVNHFFKTGELNENCNVQFGEGGAGTFSDGKLNTLVKDKKFRMKKVFSTFCKYGAPEEIMYINGPHIGTDKLQEVIKNMRNDMIKKGAEFKYDSLLTDLVIEEEKIKGIIINNSYKIECDLLVLAIGHSARETFKMLYKKEIKMESKPFAIGVRVSHPQEMININQYGKYHKMLKPASYKLSYTSKDNRGVYSFCMCPGGYVVNSSSKKGQLVINGMSNYKRDSKNANSAIVVTVSPKDFGNDIFSGMKFQEELEKKTYEACMGKIPIQLYKDFVLNRKSNNYETITPIVKGSYDFYNLNEILPKYISDNIKEAIEYFDKKIQGFSREDTLLFGCETRTSSPIRIIRKENLQASINGIYPCGEGAGYAGGITTSAMDGIKVAEAIFEMYNS